MPAAPSEAAGLKISKKRAPNWQPCITRNPICRMGALVVMGEVMAVSVGPVPSSNGLAYKSSAFQARLMTILLVRRRWGFISAVALANQSIESLKATSAAMGSVFFVEGYGSRIWTFSINLCLSGQSRRVVGQMNILTPIAYIEEVHFGNPEKNIRGPEQKPSICCRGTHTAPPSSRGEGCMA